MIGKGAVGRGGDRGAVRRRGDSLKGGGGELAAGGGVGREAKTGMGGVESEGITIGKKVQL